MGTHFFISATGTDLGKTWLTAGVAAACRARGVAVRSLKPVMSGYDVERHEDSDAARLDVGGTLAIDSITPWRFNAPLSPDLAAAQEGRKIDFAELVGWCRKQDEANPGLLLVEGIGGVMVPLDARHTVRDWIAALAIPSVLVCGSYLGSLSHTLTALAALREVGVVPVLIVVNESACSAVSLAETMESLAPHLAGVPLVTLRRDNTEDLATLADHLLRQP